MSSRAIGVLVLALVGSFAEGCDEAGTRPVGDEARNDDVALDALCLAMDINGDFVIDSGDLVAMFQTGYEQACEGCRADLDNDGWVGSGDLVLMYQAGLGPGTDEIECASPWAFADADAIGQRAALNLDDAIAEFDIELEDEVAWQVAEGFPIRGIVEDLDRPILHADGVLEVPAGFWEKVEAYANTWGDEGADLDARYVEALIQAGAIDPEYPPHADMIDFYLAHTQGEAYEHDAFRSAGVCDARCGITVQRRSYLRPQLAVDNSCGDWGSGTALGGEVSASCADVDEGGTVRARYVCNANYVVTPYCVFHESVPGSCGPDRIEDAQCMVDASFSAQGRLFADVDRDTSGDNNVAKAASRLQIRARARAAGSNSHTWEEAEFTTSASVFDIGFFETLWRLWDVGFGNTMRTILECEWGIDGPSCTGEVWLDHIFGSVSSPFEVGEEIRAISDSERRARSEVQLNAAEFPNMSEALLIPPPSHDRTYAASTGRVRVGRYSEHRFEGRVQMESWIETIAVADDDPGGSNGHTESWGSATYSLGTVQSSLPGSALRCEPMPLKDPDRLPGTRWEPTTQTWSCEGRPYELENPDFGQPDWF